MSDKTARPEDKKKPEEKEEKELKESELGEVTGGAIDAFLYFPPPPPAGRK